MGKEGSIPFLSIRPTTDGRWEGSRALECRFANCSKGRKWAKNPRVYHFLYGGGGSENGVAGANPLILFRKSLNLKANSSSHPPKLLCLISLDFGFRSHHLK